MGKDRPRDQQAVVDLLLGRLVQAGGDRQQRLAGAGLADQGHQLDFVIEQQIEGKLLLAVAGHESPRSLPWGTDQRHDAGRTGHGSGRVPVWEGLALSIEGDELVGQVVALPEVEIPLAVETVDLVLVDQDLGAAGIELLNGDLVRFVILGQPDRWHPP